jgi:hypothetical protein
LRIRARADAIDQRFDDALGERRDQRSERGADDDRDGEVDDVPPCQNSLNPFSM